MTAPLNGHPVAAPVLDPKSDVAGLVFAALAEDGETFAALPPLEQDEFLNIAEHYIAAHMAWLGANGFRVLPPNATIRPTSEAEAMAMLQAAKDFFDAAKRKGGLLGSVVPKKLIIPGVH